MKESIPIPIPMPMLFLFLLLCACPVIADDIEAYLYNAVVPSVWVQVVMDIGDADIDRVLCTYNVNCGPPFMTDAAHRHLGDMYRDAESVTAPGVFKAVLAAALENTLLDNLQLSLLISNHQDNSDTNAGPEVGGGTILMGYSQLETHREAFAATLKAVPASAATMSHRLQPVETYLEWLRYLRGGDVALGQNTEGNFGSDTPFPNYDETIIANGKYLPPQPDPQACIQLYSILFTLGSPGSDDDLDAEISAELNISQQISFTDVLSYLHDSASDLLPQVAPVVPLQKTWVVTSRDRPGDAANYAAFGGGDLLFVDDPVALQAGLTQALVATVNTVGSSMDVAVFNEGSNEVQTPDTLLIPYFLPQAGANWPGNLKKLKMASAAGNVSGGETVMFDQVVDARGAVAFDSSTEGKGQLRSDALTFWTDVAALPPGIGEKIPADADGSVVTRGGAGQKLDGFVRYTQIPGEQVQHFIGDANSDPLVDGYGPRQLFYEAESGQNLSSFDANAMTAGDLGPLLDASGTLGEEALINLIRWARGQDIQNGKSIARGWIMGDVLHSRPIALDYGATPGYSRQNPNIRIMFGSGEGAFHVLENTDTGGRESGREVFGFFPRESLGAIRWRHDNPGTALPMHYGVDGAPTVLRVDHNADGTLDAAVGDEAYVYFGLRRGGSSYFALDVSNPGAVPTLMWKISKTNSGDFDELGLTFSTPLVGKVNYSGSVVDVLIFAGGYDGGWNDDFSARLGKDLAANDDAVGNAIYIVNARTGELIWKAARGVTGVSSDTRYLHAGLTDSIASTVTALQAPDGVIHRLYVGDTGGAVWRVDLPPNLERNDAHRRNHWFITKLADLGSDAAESGGSASDDRRFFHAPDIVQSYDYHGEFDGVLIASGNRASPNETVVENALFYIKDRLTVSGSASVLAENDVADPPGRYQQTDILDQTLCSQGSEQVIEGDNSIACSDRLIRNGWKMFFEKPGEKGLSSPLTDGGRVFVSTFVPGDTTPCSSRRGRGGLYILRLDNATAATNNIRYYELGNGIPSAALPIGNSIFLPGGGIDLPELDDDVNDEGAYKRVEFLPSDAKTLYRTYWREPGIDPL